MSKLKQKYSNLAYLSVSPFATKDRGDGNVRKGRPKSVSEKVVLGELFSYSQIAPAATTAHQ